MKMLLIFLALFSQLTAYVLIFFYLWPGIILLLSSYLFLAVILFVLIRERRNEKKEEANHDYSDY
ncbi:hypothetical protein [Halobacillus sp. BBL2006]|uniref:hypothetical protein n=1 Tax=Halobacillus sp. BBL2006 TaxID=1543706 RepID=UPI0005437C9D|nr:hypothetical protein [Halobacillus sp. BBL2006]KHE67494.1 hypothetical protein LD39_17220 [Halobacillus sp. BBL2006]